MRAIRKPMHIDRANEITVSREPAGTACPISSLGLVMMPTARTLARSSSFGASEAQDASLLVGFHTEVPHLRCFHLSRFQAPEQLRGGLHSIHTYCFHGMVIAWIQIVCKGGNTRYTHYSIAYHLVWLPKYRRQIHTGELQAETKQLNAECCELQGLTLLARQTDEDHSHVFGSRAPTVESCTECQSLEKAFLAVLASEVPTTQKSLWKGPLMDEQL